jgi:hypothetical protein
MVEVPRVLFGRERMCGMMDMMRQGLVDEPVPGLAAEVDDLLVGIEDAV